MMLTYQNELASVITARNINTVRSEVLIAALAFEDWSPYFGSVWSPFLESTKCFRKCALAVDAVHDVFHINILFISLHLCFAHKNLFTVCQQLLFINCPFPLCTRRRHVWKSPRSKKWVVAKRISLDRILKHSVRKQKLLIGGLVSWSK